MQEDAHLEAGYEDRIAFLDDFGTEWDDEDDDYYDDGEDDDENDIEEDDEEDDEPIHLVPAVKDGAIWFVPEGDAGPSEPPVNWGSNDASMDDDYKYASEYFLKRAEMDGQ